MEPATEQLEIDGAQAQRMLAGTPPAALLDVREDYERQAGRIPGSSHIPLMQLAARAGELDSDRTLIVYCRAGVRSLMAAQALRQAGFEAMSLSGGMLEWVAAGRPIEPDDGTVADDGGPR